MDLKSPAGDVRMSLQARVPLLLDLRMDDVAIHGAGSLQKRPALWHFWNPGYRRTFAALFG